LKTASITLATWMAWATSMAPYAAAQPAEATQAEEAAPPSGGADDADEPRPMMGIELDDAAARGHFQVAQALFAASRYIEAGGEFEQAYELSRRPEMLFNAFVVYRDASEFERAAGVLARYLEIAPEDPSTLSLRARLVRMQARIAEQDTIEAERQRALVAQAEAERERQEAEARAEAEGQRADELTVTSAATRQGWVITASGGGLLLASGVLALVAKSRVDHLETECPNNRCGPGVTLRHDRNRARNAVIATDALWMTGAVVAGIGLVLVLTADSEEDGEATANGVGAFCDGHGCAASYQGRF